MYPHEGGELLIADIRRRGKKAPLGFPGVRLPAAAGVNMQPASLAGAAGSITEIMGGDVPILQRAVGLRERRRLSFDAKVARAVGIVLAEVET